MRKTTTSGRRVSISTHMSLAMLAAGTLKKTTKKSPSREVALLLRKHADVAATTAEAAVVETLEVATDAVATVVDTEVAMKSAGQEARAVGLLDRTTVTRNIKMTKLMT